MKLWCFFLMALIAAFPANSKGEDAKPQEEQRVTQEKKWPSDFSNFNIFYGQKTLDYDDWTPADDHDEIGFLIDFKKGNSPIGFAFAYLSSEGEGTVPYYDPWLGTYYVTIEGKTTEFDIGIRSTWGIPGGVQNYFGGGIAMVDAELRGRVSGFPGIVLDEDDAVGFWFDFGAYLPIGGVFNIGFDLRYTMADVTLLGIEADAGGAHLGIFSGFHF